MSLHNIKLTANYFAITHPEGVKNLNQYVFQKMLKKNKVDTFYSSKIIYFTNGQHISFRTLAEDKLIPMAKETYELALNQVITGKVMVALNRECSFTRQEIEEYIAINGSQPKGNSGKKRKNLTAEEAITFTKSALSKKGLTNVNILSYRSGPRLNIMKIDVETMDIEFSGTVHDLREFESAWLYGIGRDKTYGFGMIRLQGSRYIASAS